MGERHLCGRVRWQDVPRAQGFLSVLSDPGPRWPAPSDYLNQVEDPETLTLGFLNSQTAKMTSLTSTFFF